MRTRRKRADKYETNRGREAGDMRLYKHLILGLIVAIIFITVAKLDERTTLTAATALVVGSIFPDIDHPFSHMRRIFRGLLFVVFFLLAIVFLNTPPVFATLANFCNVCSGWTEFFILLIAAAIISIIFVSIIDFLVPFHRGPLHGILAALIFGLVCSLISLRYTDLNIIVGIAGTVGYLSHIISDMLTSK